MNLNKCDSNKRIYFFANHQKKILAIFSNIPISFIEYIMLKAHIDQQNIISDIKLKNRYNTIKSLSIMKISFDDIFTSNVKQKMKAIIWEI